MMPDIRGAMIILFLIGIVLGGIFCAIFGKLVPWLWGIVKPFIHQITA